jgi:hypothetical protein
MQKRRRSRQGRGALHRDHRDGTPPSIGHDGYYTDWPEEAKGHGERFRYLTWKQVQRLPPSPEKAGFGYGVHKRMVANRARG